MMTNAHDSSSPPWPPVFVRAALRLLLRADERAEALSELRELWEGRVAREGEVAARRWYARELRGYPARLLRYRAHAVLARLGGRNAPPVVEAVHGASWLESVRGDVAQSLRAWEKSPVLALTVILTVGLGLGASTAMLAIVRVVLLDPLPYAASDRLVRIYHALGENRWPLAMADYLAIEAEQTLLTPPTRRGPFMLTIAGRLKRDTNMAAAGAELQAIIKRNWPDATST